MTLPRSLVRTLSTAAFALLTLLVPLRPALAADFTDAWITFGEDGWGVQFLQWGNTLWATFYIYGPDNQPVWYDAVMGWDGSSKFAGTLFSEQGTYFGKPWNPAEQIEGVAGSATFTPSTSNNYQGTLVYTVNTSPMPTTVTKAIQRLTVVAVPLGGTYYGGQAGAYSGSSCTNSGAYSDFFTLQVTQSAGNNISLNFSYGFDNPALTCTLSGTLSQNGVLYSVSSATYQCSDGLNTNATLSDIKVTAQGIEGVYAAPVVGGGCREDARFSAAHN